MIIATRQPYCCNRGRHIGGKLLRLKNRHILRGSSFPFRLLLPRCNDEAGRASKPASQGQRNKEVKTAVTREVMSMVTLHFNLCLAFTLTTGRSAQTSEAMANDK
jgi:hypothetical protein